MLNFAIVSELDGRRRRRAAALWAKPAPPLIAPLLVSVVIVPALATPEPATALPDYCLRRRPVIAPPFFSVAIAPEFAIPAPPATRRGSEIRALGASVSAADLAHVGQRRNRAGITIPRRPRRPPRSRRLAPGAAGAPPIVAPVAFISDPIVAPFAFRRPRRRRRPGR